MKKRTELEQLLEKDREVLAKKFRLQASIFSAGSNEEKFFRKLEEYMEEKGGYVQKELLVIGGLKAYISGISEKMLREVIISYIQEEAAEYKWTAKLDDGPLVVDEHGTVKWSEIVIA